MSLVRITKPSSMCLIDSVGLDFIAYLMNVVAKEYYCTELVFSIYRRPDGMDQSLVAKFDSSSRTHFAMGDYSYPYTYFENFSDNVIKPYYIDGKFPGRNPALYHDGKISYGMVLDAKGYELIIGLTVGGPARHGYLACGCLAKLLLFTINSTNSRCRKSVIFGKEQETYDQLKSSVSKIWEYIAQTEGPIAVEVSDFVDGLLRGDDPADHSVRCMLDILQPK